MTEVVGILLGLVTGLLAWEGGQWIGQWWIDHDLPIRLAIFGSVVLAALALWGTEHSAGLGAEAAEEDKC